MKHFSHIRAPVQKQMNKHIIIEDIGIKSLFKIICENFVMFMQNK
jgi:hypothetical protein